MIRKISIENYFSFGDMQMLDFSIKKNATDPDCRFAKPIESNDDQFPRVVAIFGANASGKTNLLRAISFLKDFVLNSAVKPRESKIEFLTFFARQYWEKHTRISVEFDAEINEGKGREKFQYNLVLANDYYSVIEESLYIYPFGRRRRVFSRINNEITPGQDFGLSENDPVREKLRSNASVISTLAQFNHPYCVALYNSVNTMMVNVSVTGRMLFDPNWAINYYSNNDECFRALNENIGKFDFGIESVNLELFENKQEALFQHTGLTSDIRLTFESEGTKNFFTLFPMIWYALKTGTVVILDELDNDIHPLLLPEIIKMFQNSSINTLNAQLIFSCHNASILDYLCKEEVYFTEKDEGSTLMYGLKDVQGVRRDSNIYAKYLAGVFGGIPRVG
ncbi:MAG: AAA family ATPase [Rhodospirillales bacterium]|nr:AAA family ATPase [Rhodospirillales bacterium]